MNLQNPKRYKPNTINGNLYRSKRISWNLDKEIVLMREKFMKADYPLRFINSVINEFHKGKNYGDESFITLSNLFGIAETFVSIEIPYCELNEIKLKHFLNKLQKFTNDSVSVVIMQKTRNILSLFPLKDKNNYKSCVIYKEDCSCVSSYIGQTKRKANATWNEHNNPNKSSKPSKHLPNNIDHCFTCGLLFQMLQTMLRPGRT